MCKLCGINKSFFFYAQDIYYGATRDPLLGPIHFDPTSLVRRGFGSKCFHYANPWVLSGSRMDLKCGCATGMARGSLLR